MLKKTVVNTNEIELLIKIDTLGIAKSIEFKSTDPNCTVCNEILFNAIKDMRRWKPSFSFTLTWQSCPIAFEDKELILKMKIIDSNVYINGKRERRGECSLNCVK